MTFEQETIAEKIIHIFKANESPLYWEQHINPQALDLQSLDETRRFQIIRLVRDELIAEGYIEKTSEQMPWYRLTEKGRDFVSFEDARQQKDQTKVVKQLEFLNLKQQVDSMSNQLLDYEETKSRAKWAIRLTVLGLIITVVLSLLPMLCNKPG